MRVKLRPDRNINNLTIISESIVYNMWEPQRLTILWASTTCYRDIVYLGTYYNFVTP
jgi:hypothetical protein